MNSCTNTTPDRNTASPVATPQRPLPKWMRAIEQTDTTFVIDAWLALDPTSQDAFLAQLIAAAVNDGPASALHRFGQTGILDASAALAEVNDLAVPIEREPWLDALGRYIISTGNRS